MVESVIGILTAAAALLGVVIGKVLDMRARAQENAEWYKRAAFDKRVTAIQEARLWARRLELGFTSSGQNLDPVLLKDADEWFSQN